MLDQYFYNRKEKKVLKLRQSYVPKHLVKLTKEQYDWLNFDKRRTFEDMQLHFKGAKTNKNFNSPILEESGINT